MLSVLHHIGAYFLMLNRVFSFPAKPKVFMESLSKEVENVALRSFWIVVFISTFVGAIMTVQTAYNTKAAVFLPKYFIALATRQSVLLEFAPTFTCIILSGQVGSYISSSLGTMRVTEQIDALEVMGINSLSHLVLPKIIACTTLYPLLVIMGMICGMGGGWIVGNALDLIPTEDFIYGLKLNFNAYHIVYSLIKTVIFAFLIATVPSYFGYYIKGGAMEVGRASTQSAIWTSIFIVLMNYVATQILL